VEGDVDPVLEDWEEPPEPAGDFEVPDMFTMTAVSIACHWENLFAELVATIGGEPDRAVRLGDR
jgi:hypothetical protein